METVLLQFAVFLKLGIELAAVLIVAFGAGEALIGVLAIVVHPATTHGRRKAVWRRFGVWLLIGLEFTLAADIVGSAISPTWQEIGELAAIAAIRTFLNYFLEKDLESSDESVALAPGGPAPVLRQEDAGAFERAARA